jgi:hypothetical protein
MNVLPRISFPESVQLFGQRIATVKDSGGIDLIYDTGAILIYGMLRGQTDNHLTRKNYKTLIFKAIKS